MKKSNHGWISLLVTKKMYILLNFFLRTECETKLEKDCSPREERLCKTVQELQKVYAIENVCVLKDINICDKVLECVGAYCKEKIEVDDLSTCRFSHKENVCEDVKKYRAVNDQKGDSFTME